MKSFRTQKKAISPAIAAILLVFIVISAAASAYYFYRDIVEETSGDVEENLDREISELYAGLRISNATTIGFNIENTGSVNLYDIKVYEEGSHITTISSLAPGQTYSEYLSLTLGSTLYAIASYADDRRVIAAAPVLNAGASISSIEATGESGQDVQVGSAVIQSQLVEVN